MANLPNIARFSSFELMNDRNVKRILIEVPESLQQRLRIFCAVAATTNRDVIMGALLDFFEKHKGIDNPPPVIKPAPKAKIPMTPERERELREWLATPNDEPAGGITTSNNGQTIALADVHLSSGGGTGPFTHVLTEDGIIPLAVEPESPAKPLSFEDEEGELEPEGEYEFEDDEPEEE